MKKNIDFLYKIAFFETKKIQAVLRFRNLLYCSLNK